MGAPDDLKAAAKTAAANAYVPYSEFPVGAALRTMPGTNLFSPCGGCRQVIAEFMPADGKIWATNDGDNLREWTANDLLPDGFSFDGLS